MNAHATDPAPRLPAPATHSVFGGADPGRIGRVTRAVGAVAARPGLLRIGTRGSALAVAQTTTVAEAIAAATGLDVTLVIVTTQGDTSRAPLAQLGGTGVFVSALRDALAAGECDFAVHSLKDLPTGACPGIVIGAIPERADARDALCSRGGVPLAELPAGGKVGTGSPRRAAQILAGRPDLEVLDIRGNVDTRLARIEHDLDAVVLAAAGLDRLGRGGVISERFPLAEVPTAPGQGALAIEVRSADAASDPYRTALAALDDPTSHACAAAERALLASLEAGCAAPVGARAEVSGGRLRLSAAVYRLDGGARLDASADAAWEPRGDATDDVAARLGRAVSDRLLADGAAELAPLGNRA
ncbi:hydroxymethylbilane synthase [Leucobacter zeae]|nr:hydroxymethylbilane synthase [Leucobacter zeae]